jgi:TonB family protein
MIAEMLRVLAVATLASSAAIVLILALRKPLRHRFGAGAACAAWALVPLAACSALLPAPVARTQVIKVAPAVDVAASPVQPAVYPAIESTIDRRPWLLALWLLGGCVVAVALSVQQRRYVRALGALSEQADGTRRARTRCAGPALVGAWRARIVVPADFGERYSARERRLILAHERLHRARGDAQASLLAAAMRCVFWFNPLVHVGAARFRFDQELACDALVLARFPRARAAYATALLKTQLGAAEWQLALPAGCAWQSTHPLTERVAMLKRPLPSRTRRVAGTFVAALLVGVGTLAAWAAQPAQLRASASLGAGNPLRADVLLTVDGAALDEAWPSSTFDAVALVTDGRGLNNGSSHLVIREGEPFSITIERPKGESWRFGGVARVHDDGTIAFDGEVAHDGDVLERPQRMLRDGETTVLRVGTENAGGAFKGLGAQLTLARAPDERAPEAQALRARTAPHASHPGGDDRAATFRSVHRIAYPPAALDASVDGVVYVRVHVDANGNLANADVARIDPPGATVLGPAALDGIKAWRFSPAFRDGLDVPSDEIVPVVFALRPDAVPKVDGGTLDAIRVTPPDDETATGGYQPPAEDTAYRKMFPPVYPPEAIRARIMGDFVFKVYVDDHGVPQSVELDSSKPSEAAHTFTKTSIDAIMQWRFYPAFKDWRPVGGYVLVPISFALDDTDKQPDSAPKRG